MKVKPLNINPRAHLKGFFRVKISRHSVLMDYEFILDEFHLKYLLNI